MDRKDRSSSEKIKSKKGGWEERYIHPSLETTDKQNAPRVTSETKGLGAAPGFGFITEGDTTKGEGEP